MKMDSKKYISTCPKFPKTTPRGQKGPNTRVCTHCGPTLLEMTSFW